LAQLLRAEFYQLAKGAMRRERDGHTLSPTDLVHEVFLRLMEDDVWSKAENRAYLFGAVSRSPPQVLVDHARKRAAAKHGGGWTRTPPDEALEKYERERIDLLALNEALEKSGILHPRQRQIVDEYHFGGYTLREITCGKKRGVERWRIRCDAVAPHSELGIDAFQTVLASPDSWQICLHSEGEKLAVIERKKSQALLLDLEGTSQTVVLRDHPGISRIALSPNGRWAATGSWWGRGTRVWETRSGKCVCELPGEEMRDDVQVAFSGDDRWLVTGTSSGYRFWQVETWQPGPIIPTDHEFKAQLALTREGKIMAITPSPNVIRLVDLDTRRELATLKAPETQSICWLCFSRNGSQLAAACANQVIQVWDLRYLRQELATRGLDWDPRH
jgi:RNA polymerase sigma factor (TIGR02999 family)